MTIYERLTERMNQMTEHARYYIAQGDTLMAAAFTDMACSLCAERDALRLEDAGALF